MRASMTAASKGSGPNVQSLATIVLPEPASLAREPRRTRSELPRARPLRLRPGGARRRKIPTDASAARSVRVRGEHQRQHAAIVPRRHSLSGRDPGAEKADTRPPTFLNRTVPDDTVDLSRLSARELLYRGHALLNANRVEAATTAIFTVCERYSAADEPVLRPSCRALRALPRPPWEAEGSRRHLPLGAQARAEESHVPAAHGAHLPPRQRAPEGLRRTGRGLSFSPENPGS